MMVSSQAFAQTSSPSLPKAVLATASNVFISGNTIVPTNLTSIIRGVSLGNAFGRPMLAAPPVCTKSFPRITR